MKSFLFKKWHKFLNYQDYEKDIVFISYSQFKNWYKCPRYHWLLSIEKLIDYPSNEYTMYGNVMHEMSEKFLLERSLGLSSTEEENKEFFKRNFLYRFSILKNDEKTFDKEKSLKMFAAGLKLYPKMISELEKKFGTDFKIIDVEYVINEPIDFHKHENISYRFKGYVDIVLQTNDGKFHIVDWKTTVGGWGRKQRSDKSNLYQMILYKYFFSKKENIEPKNIEVHYGFLVTKSKNINWLDITSGDKRTKNCLNSIKSMLITAFERKIYMRAVDCKYCECRRYDLVKN